MLEMFVPGASAERRDLFSRYQREAANAADAADILEALGHYRVTPYLERISVPTLVMHRRDDRVVSVEQAREITAAIPDARFIALDGQVHLPYWGDTEPLLRAIEDFLSGAAPGRYRADTSHKVRTVLFTDLVGHTEMMQRLGDAKGRDLLREHERITRDLLKRHGGAEVKTMGDGFMASFGSVTKAMDCAIALQRAFASHTASTPEPLNVRVGLNAGEPIEEDGDLFGSTVILASRIAAKAGAGEILVPDTVRGLLSGKGYVFGDRGEFVPKGFDEGVRLWDVRWQE
jgi:class 3 adenylate cyclase